MIKYAMISLGCPKNQVDAERMLSLLGEGFARVEPQEADVAIINTCGFIEDAKKEAIDAILEMGELKDSGSMTGIVVTGCLAERYRSKIKELLPEVDVILGAGSNNDIEEAVRLAASGGRLERYDDIEIADMGGGRVLTTPSYTAYLKLGDGCDNKCTYCAIPLIRGKMRSRPIESLLAEAKELANGGVSEIILVAQDTTRYGEDLYGKNRLVDLIKELEKIDGIKWIRMLYCYPDRMSDELIEHMARSEKLLNYIDLPLQHGSDSVLKRMNRRGTKAEIVEMLTKLRAAVPDVAIRTTFIVGFPGETQEEFEELCAFLQEMRFDRVGCFAYSAEEDTPAASFDGQHTEETKGLRTALLMGIQSGISNEKIKGHVGRTLDVLVEGEGVGRSYLDAPEIDGLVYFDGMGEVGSYVKVLVERTDEYDLFGKVIG